MIEKKDSKKHVKVESIDILHEFKAKKVNNGYIVTVWNENEFIGEFIAKTKIDVIELAKKYV